MLNWDEVILSINRSGTKDFDRFSFFSLGEREISTSERLDYAAIIKEIVGQNEYEELVKEYTSDGNLVGPFSLRGWIVAFWVKENEIKISVIFKNQTLPNYMWLLQSIFYIYEFHMEFNIENILEIRYRYPSIVGREHYFPCKSEDPFLTIPETYFRSIVFGEPFKSDSYGEFTEIINDISLFLEQVLQRETLTEGDGEVLSNLFSTLFSFESSERYYIGLNFLDSLVFCHTECSLFSKQIIDLIFNQIDELQKKGWTNLAWLYTFYLNYFFDATIPLPPKEINDSEVPSWYLLIPQIRKILENNRREQDTLLEELIQLNNEIVKSDVSYIGQEYLYEMIGYLSAEVKNYLRASTFFNLASDFYFSCRDNQKAVTSRKNAIQSSLLHFKEFAIAANLHHYLGEIPEGTKFAWRALNIALSTIKFASEVSFPFCQDVVEEIFYDLDLCKRALLSSENEMSPVIQLKLDELEGFLVEIIENKLASLDNIQELILMHQESMKFLMPQSPPLFLVLTTDGRLIYSVKATSDLQSEEINISHLMAGVLTAVRSIFQEASFSGGGSVKEISTGDSTLLIEARDNIVVVASAVSMSQEIRSFTNEVASEINHNFSNLIDNWDGSVSMMDPIVDHFNEKLRKTLL